MNITRPAAVDIVQCYDGDAAVFWKTVPAWLLAEYTELTGTMLTFSSVPLPKAIENHGRFTEDWRSLKAALGLAEDAQCNVLQEAIRQLTARAIHEQLT